MSTQEHKREDVLIDVGPGSVVRGKLSLPPISLAVAVILCDDGPRAAAERLIAEALERDGCATLSVRLSSELTQSAAPGSQPPRGDVELLAARLVAVTEWLSQNPDMQPMNIGYFAYGTASAASFLAAARAPDYIDAIVTVAGRADLAGEALEQVRAATLLITSDHGANMELNRAALRRIRAEKNLALVSSTGSPFSEPAALERVAALCSEWFVRHLMSRSHSIPA